MIRDRVLIREFERIRATGKIELRDAAAAENKAQPIHRWVPWIAGFSSQFAADAIEAYLPAGRRSEALVLDPFAGVATTLVEALKAGCNAVGYEINPFAALAACAKINCVDVDRTSLGTELRAFREAMGRFESSVDACWMAGGAGALEPIVTKCRLAPPHGFKSRIPFFSPTVEAKFLFALQWAKAVTEPNRSLLRAALGATMISYSNYSYEPSLSSRPSAGKPLIENASVALPACQKLDDILEDICWLEDRYSAQWRARRREVVHGSYFDSTLQENSVSLLVTSPPYMNNYHYVRNTRAHLHWLEFLDSSAALRPLEESSFGKYWQTVRQGPAVRLRPRLPALEKEVERLRLLNADRAQYGGAGWANYVATYFNDSDRFLASAKTQLKPGARAVIVVGNSIIQGIEFKVDQILGEMAEEHGFVVEEIRIVRAKRVGTSIIDSSVRNGNGNGQMQKTKLYDAALVLRA